MLNIILFGPPGSGKGTQAERLVNQYGLKQISTGALVRKEIDSGSEVGASLALLTASGDLVPDRIVTDLFRVELARGNPHGYIFDGYPRTTHQVAELQALMDGLSLTVDLVVELRIPDAALVERVSGRFLCKACGNTFHDSFAFPANGVCCGAGWTRRPEDNPEALKKRLERYHTNTREVLALFADHPRFRIIDAAHSMEDVARSIRSCVNALEDD
ncbi:MAG: adenylate kinase [Stutzerimonas stutzeri]|nr:MAG: adenylate kinase [Stutzerimonas stutzeri]